jgi:hypothetical protein
MTGVVIGAALVFLGMTFGLIEALTKRSNGKLWGWCHSLLTLGVFVLILSD